MIRNFFHLSILRGINLVFPVLLMPYLLRTIGIDHFGLFSTAWAYLGLMILLGEGGFHTYCTRAVAQAAGDYAALSKLFWNINVLKILTLLVIAAIIFLANFFLLRKGVGMAVFYASGLLMALGQCLQPVWFFQGLEKMHKLVYLNLISKVISIIAIFIFVHQPEDYAIALLVMSIGDITACVIANWIARHTMPFESFSFSILQLKHYFKGILPFFQTNIGISVYSILPTLLLSWFTNETVVGYYSIAERLNNVVKTILIIFDQSIYPQLFKKVNESHSVLTEHVKKFFYPYFLGMLCLSSIIFAFAPQIIQLVGNEPFPQAVLLLRIMLVIPIIIVLDMPSISMLIVYGHEKIVGYVMTIAAILNLALNLTLIPKYGAMAVACNLLLTEIVVLLLVTYYSNIRHKTEAVFR